MSLLRGLLFDNLGLKLVALLLAVMVYLNVYTDRPATMIAAAHTGRTSANAATAAAISVASPSTASRPAALMRPAPMPACFTDC